MSSSQPVTSQKIGHDPLTSSNQKPARNFSEKDNENNAGRMVVDALLMHQFNFLKEEKDICSIYNTNLLAIPV